VEYYESQVHDDVESSVAYPEVIRYRLKLGKVYSVNLT